MYYYDFLKLLCYRKFFKNTHQRNVCVWEPWLEKFETSTTNELRVCLGAFNNYIFFIESEAFSNSLDFKKLQNLVNELKVRN